MSHTEYLTATMSVDQTPDEVFTAITNVRGWWSENVIGDTATRNDQFVFTEYTHDEWTGTNVIFDITATSNGTTLHFTHEGLTAADSDCFEACSRGWTFYITKSLPQLIATGTGQPMPKGA